MSTNPPKGEAALPPMSGSVALVHQTQPTPYTCAHTCLAMVLGRPVEEVMHEVKELAGMNTHDLLNALERYGVMHALTMFGALWSGWQLVTVPSLNVRGGTHKVLVHWEAGKYHVLDPSPKIRYAEDGSDLNSWHDVILVRPPNAGSDARRAGLPDQQCG